MSITRTKHLAIVILITVFSMLYTGSDFGVADHTIEIPIAKAYANPALYPGDVGLKAWLSYPTPFWLAVGCLSRYLDLRTLLVALHVLSRFGTLLAVYLITQSLTGSPGIGFLSCLVLAVDRPVGTSGWLSTMMIHQEAAMPFLLLGLYGIIAGRYISGTLALGSGLLLHAINGGYTLLGLVTFELLDWRKKSLRKYLACLLLLSAFVSPVLFLRSQGNIGSDWDLTQYLSFLRWRGGHHVFPTTWSTGVWIGYWAWMGMFVLWVHGTTDTAKVKPGGKSLSIFILGIAILEYVVTSLGYNLPPVGKEVILLRAGVITVVVTWILQVAYNNRNDTPRLLLLSVAGTAFGLHIAGIVLTEIVPVALFMQLQLFRSSFLIYVAGSILLALYVARRWPSQPWLIRFALVGSAVAWSVGDAMAQVHFASMVLLSEFLGSRPRLVRAGVLAALASYLIFLFVPALSWLTSPASIMALRTILLAGVPLVVSVVFVTASYVSRATSKRRQWQWLTLGALLIALAVSRQSLRQALRSEQSFQDWVSVQLWAKEHTAVDDTFIVPPGGLSGFRVFSERPVVTEFKDGNAIFHSPSFVREWSNRMQDVGRTPGSYEFDSFQEADFLRIAHKYHARYLVVGIQKTLNFPQVYENGSFRVYDLGSTSGLMHISR